ncbi:MAG TPA: hypothetical protein DCO75_03615 [Fibrobacteres bacterium]|nr:hypothetical protein [Fibrobacterota bacterium]
MKSRRERLKKTCRITATVHRKKCEKGYQLKFNKPDGKSGYDFILISLLDSAGGFFIQYGNE